MTTFCSPRWAQRCGSILPADFSGGDPYLNAVTLIGMWEDATAINGGAGAIRQFLVRPGDELHDFATLTFMLDNNSSIPIQRQLYFAAYVDAVPEPAQWLVMLLGLAILGMRAKAGKRAGLEADICIR